RKSPRWVAARLTRRAGMVSPVAIIVHVRAGSVGAGPAGWKRPLSVSLGAGVGVAAGVGLGVTPARPGAPGTDPAGAHPATAAARRAATAAPERRRNLMGEQLTVEDPRGGARHRRPRSEVNLSPVQLEV